MTAPQYQRYPMVMRHPGERAAVISQWDEKLKRHVPEHGEPAKFQPVTVHNADDEEYHAAQGYRPTGGDAQTFTQQVNDNIVNPKPAGYAFNEYPKWVDGVLVQDPAKPVTTFQEYPKWVGDVMVHSAAEERALKAPSSADATAAALPAALTTVEPPAMQEIVIDGVSYSVPPAVAAQLLAKQAQPNQSAASETSASTGEEVTAKPAKTPRARKAKAAEAAPVTSRRSYRDRTGALASSVDAAAAG